MALSASTPESLIPGDIAVIDRAIETIGSSVAPARQVAQAWEVMALPTWRGQAGSAWNAFAPRETGRIRLASPALNRAASAMSAYRAAFVSARAEAQEAIVDAVRAKRATQQARAEHREAARRAASADPGTPAATLAPFTDPGTTALTAAQARVDAARARLQRIGDEIAAEIRAASGDASGVRAGLRGSQISLASFPVPRGSARAADPPAADPFGNPTAEDWEQAWPVFQGFGEAAADTVVSLWQLLPIQPIIDELLGKPGWNDYEKRWKTIGEGYAHLRTNPLDALVEWAKNFISYDMWEKEPGRALGHTLFNFAGVAGILKGALKLKKPGRTGRVPESGLNAPQRAMVDQLINDGIKISPEKVVTIMKTPEGRIVWLEKGTTTATAEKPSGLAHIVERHGTEFAQKGISEDQIPELLTRAIQGGNIIGNQGKGNSRPIYQIDYRGASFKIAITIGSNGYIVGANLG